MNDFEKGLHCVEYCETDAQMGLRLLLPWWEDYFVGMIQLYVFLGKILYIYTNIYVFVYYSMPGPQLDPMECGTPIFCIFYGIISIIFLFAIYSNIKGETVILLDFLQNQE